MNVTRDVIVDLFPLYLAGEASADTRALVEEYLKQDPELAGRVRLQWTETLKRAVPSGLPPELELVSVKRTRRLLFWQRCLFGFALFFSAFGMSLEFSTRNGHFQQMHFLLRDHPALFGGSLALALVLWAAYFAVQRRVRVAGF